MKSLLSAFAVASILASSAAFAAPINVVNGDFESGGALSEGQYTPGLVQGWSASVQSGRDNSINSGPNTSFPGFASDDITAYVGVYRGGDAFDLGSLYQQLDASLEAGMLYTLGIDIGRRADGYDLPSFAVELWSGNTLLTSGSYTNDDVAAGTFRRLTLSYLSTEAGSDKLAIRIHAFADPTLPNGGYQQVALNNVTLDATVVDTGPIETPEPGMLGLLGLGMIGVGASRRRTARAR